MLEGLVAFPPNRATLGGTAYLLTTAAGNVLVDSPPWTVETQAYLRDRPVRWFFLTHRNAMAQVKTIQAALDCEVVVQEQEAYLLPELTVTTFQQEGELTPGLTALWTPGYSPGSACLYWAGAAAGAAAQPKTTPGGVLFTGRHLLPTPQGGIAPLRTSKTFHWPRQLRSLAQLQARFSPAQLGWICPGGSIGFLRGDRCLDQGGQRLQALDLAALAQAPIGP
ncbi:MAG: MBL fold metallo-hydrolase [Synechococcales cyanobacterium RM1_1_8]|nr:MBL fold metallo-hydrolase [Synechococcales cyanobacterium RM1_1_8]